MSVAAVLSPSNGWKVHTTHANGDCFFKSLQLALRTIGNYYDILDLRHHVAKRVLDPNDLEMNYVIQTWCEIYRAAESSGDTDLIREVQHVQCIAKSNVGNDLSGHERLQLYKSMMSKLYWADENTIRTLERALRLRFLIFDAENNVGFHPVTQKESFPGDIYIILHFYGSHYSPFSKNGRMVFLREMLPPEIRWIFQKYI
jgi:hypothetical protein